MCSGSQGPTRHHQCEWMAHELDRDAAAKVGCMNNYLDIAQHFSRLPEVTLGKMFGTQVMKARSEVFAMNYANNVVVKLPRDRALELSESSKCSLFDPGHGRTMKQWISVSEDSDIFGGTL